jgi:hypothetical protein
VRWIKTTFPFPPFWRFIMVGATLCVSCAALPLKDRKGAIKVMKCPECQTTIGVTSYGSAFRVEAAKRPRLLAPAFVSGTVIGAALFIFVVALTGLGLWSKEQVARPTPPPVPPPSNELARVPEIAVDKRFAPGIQPAEAKRQIVNLIERIRLENGKQQDAFLLAQMDVRPELRGLPFVMGAACRLDMNRAQSFQSSVQAVRDGMEVDSRSRGSHQNEHTPFWNTYLAEGQGVETEHGVAALTQILGPERKTMRMSLVHRLKSSNRPEATKAVARAAIFDSDGDTRVAAIKAIKEEHKEQAAEVTEVLMHGIRYPLAIVAKRTAQAMIALDRKDLMPELVKVLGEPAPGDPIVSEHNGSVVREVVRINHHRNCLLCHPPSHTGNTQEVPGVIPIPGSPFPTSPGEAYGNARSLGEPMVRADTTYLRQDFSVMMPVENAAPWPEMQRFDFLVRTRPLEGKELAALQQKMQARAADYLSENHKVVVRVLSELSGLQNVAPTQVAWQRAFGAERAE